MGSFFFNVRDGETLTRDPEPYLFSTVQLAHDSAMQMVRELFDAHAADESLDERRIEITDETGHLVSSVDVNEAQSAKGRLRTRQSSPSAFRELKI